MQQLNIVLMERWPHPVAANLLGDRPHLRVTAMGMDSHDHNWVALERAHVYQTRSTRSELPQQYWADAPLFSRCENMLVISTNGSGYDTVNLDACTEAGVIVVNQAGGNKQGVAEHALGMMLVLTKRIVEADRAMRKVTGLEREQYMGNDAHGKTLGIVGLGNVGTHVARLAGGLLNMRVLAFDPFIEASAFAERGAEQADFDTLLRESDFISVHCPRNSSSEWMFDAGAYARMKPSAYFVTTARGGVHDEGALAQALADKQIAGAGLDVWDPEPPALDHPLLQFDNVIVSPHTAGVTHESRANVVVGTIEQIDEIAHARRPPRLLNPEAWPKFVSRYETLFGVTPS